MTFGEEKASAQPSSIWIRSNASALTGSEHPLAGEEVIGEVKDDEQDAQRHGQKHCPVQHPENEVPRLAAGEEADHRAVGRAGDPGRAAMPIS